MNLLKEIIDELDFHRLTLDDVTIIWEGKLITDYSVLDFDYDNGYSTQIVRDLFLIIDKTHWFERREYDGSEWFEYVRSPSDKYSYLLNRECRRICGESCEFCSLETVGHGDVSYCCKIRGYYAPLHRECYYPNEYIEPLIKENKKN